MFAQHTSQFERASARIALESRSDSCRERRRDSTLVFSVVPSLMSHVSEPRRVRLCMRRMAWMVLSMTTLLAAGCGSKPPAPSDAGGDADVDAGYDAGLFVCPAPGSDGCSCTTDTECLAGGTCDDSTHTCRAARTCG